VLLNVITQSFEVGVTIILDVFVLTLLLFRSKTLTWNNWVLPLTCSHVLFSLTGLALVILAKNQLWLFGIVGILGSLLIFALLTEMSCEWLGTKVHFSATEQIKKLLGPTLAKFFTPLVLAVSWDALVGGPGLMLEIAKWPLIHTLVGFSIIAAVVSGGTLLAIAVSHLLNSLGRLIPRLLLILTYGGKLGLMALLSTFMINGLNLSTESFGLETTIEQPVLIALLLTLCFFLLNHRILLVESRKEVIESLQGALKIDND
jgi:hypothetical protein